MPAQPTISPDARAAILAWYAERGRPLAFRRTSDPWAILVSEAMAQQTQAARAADHWERFMATFPTVHDVAAASPADILRAWSGLGYDRRALALRRTAQRIVADHDGRVPDDLDALQALPGVGPYTARAVAALAFGRPVGAVDVNVRRVLGRIVAGSPDALGPAALQAMADAAVPPDAPGSWTHAVMDLGATICRPRSPRCDACPARAWCRAAASGAMREAAPARQRPTTTSPAPTFESTNRWLRGRILERLRAGADGTWLPIAGPIGTHDPERVAAALEAMARDGLLEIRPPMADEPPAARLPLT